MCSRASHDVFISYAHIDNLPETEGEAGWVEKFAERLRLRLLKKSPYDVDVWWDANLGPGQVFDAELFDQLHHSAVLLCLLSPRYLDSDYCRQEAGWFVNKARREPEGLKVAGNYARVQPVLLYNISPEKWPEHCRGPSGFAFHDSRDERLGDPLDPRSEAFDQVLKKLVYDVNMTLSAIGPRQAPDDATTEGAETTESADTADFSVFLAKPPEDLARRERKLEKALVAEGIDVIRSIPPPYDEPEHTAAVEEAVKKTHLSVHLLSNSAGEPLGSSSSGSTYPMEQLRISLACGESHLALFPEEFRRASISDRAYGGFINELLERSLPGDKLKRSQVERSRFLGEILARRERFREATQLRQRLADDATAFVDVHIDDVPNSADLASYLLGHSIVPVLGPSTGMELFERNVSRARLLIVVFGSVARKWVDHRLQAAYKLILQKRLKTPMCVYVGPPHKPDSELQFPGNTHVAVNMDAFDPRTVEALIEEALPA